MCNDYRADRRKSLYFDGDLGGDAYLAGDCLTRI